VGALAVHVGDEALTDFLGFYNPLVLRIRGRIPWYPMPTFRFSVWLGGLIVLVVALLLLAPVVRRGAFLGRMVSWALTVAMFGNGLAHLVGSIYFSRWLPGATSAPLLLVAAALMARANWGHEG